MADDPANEAGRILIGKSDVYQYLTLALGNRHGLGRVYNQNGIMRMLTAYIIAAKQVSVFS
jgi:hypothetical protein